MMTVATVQQGLQVFVPAELRHLADLQRDLPRIARDRRLLAQIAEAVRRIPTRHRLFNHDARDLSLVDDASVHLVVTSPPYWTLKPYRSRCNWPSGWCECSASPVTEKQWDLVLVIDGQLVGAVELKSHIGPSFGNNFNNRTESG